MQINQLRENLTCLVIFIEQITDAKITKWKQEENKNLRKCKPDEGTTIVTGYF